MKIQERIVPLPPRNHHSSFTRPHTVPLRHSALLEEVLAASQHGNSHRTLKPATYRCLSLVLARQNFRVTFSSAHARNDGRGKHVHVHVFTYMAMDSSASSKTVVCPHCLQQLCIKTYKAHKRLYFDADTNKWCKKRKVQPAVDFVDSDILKCFKSDSCEEVQDEGEGQLCSPSANLSGDDSNTESKQDLGMTTIDVCRMHLSYSLNSSYRCQIKR